MDSPSPVPPTRCALPSCVKASKTAACSGSGMPGPVSETLKCRRHLSPSMASRPTRIWISPCSVYLTAFDIRLPTHLAQAQHVALDGGRHGRLDAADELELLALGAAGEQLPDLLGELADVERLADQVHLAGLDLRVVEDVVDDLHHRLGGGAHRVHVAPLPLVEVGAGEQLRHAEHAVHRRADLVAHVGEELVLRPGERLRAAQAAPRARCVRSMISCREVTRSVVMSRS